MRPAAEPGQHFLRQVAACSPISRKFFAPASTHATATASMNTSVYRGPASGAGPNPCQHLQQAGQLVIGAGHSGYAHES